MQVTTYLREVRDELKKVTFPKREEAIKMTLIVIGASIVVALYVGGLDVLFTRLLGLFIR